MIIIDSCVFIDTFDPKSPNHTPAVELLKELRARELSITMPAHGWFEVQCTLQRLTEQQEFVGPIFDGKMNYPIELIYIDEGFIKKYSMVNIPYIRAGDHIFIVVAKVNECPLVTNDEEMIAKSNECGVQVFTPTEFKDELDSA